MDQIKVRIGALLYRNGGYEGELKVSYQNNSSNIPKRDLFVHVHTEKGEPVLDLDTILEREGKPVSLTVPEERLVAMTAEHIVKKWPKLLKELTPRSSEEQKHFWSDEQRRLYANYEEGKQLRGGYLKPEDRLAVHPDMIGARKRTKQKGLTREFAKRGGIRQL